MQTIARLAQQIHHEALSLGYEACGILRLDELVGYTAKLEERMERFPDTRERLTPLLRLATPSLEHPWAQSVIIVAYRYDRYQIPATLQNRIAKYYLVDSRADEAAPAYALRQAFDAFLRCQGLKTAGNAKFGPVPLRWAAVQAGLGIIRNNNFLYRKSGSWLHLDAWLIDQPLEWKEECQLPPCPPNCRRCQKACPTQALCAPYAMHRNRCISAITCWDGRNMPQEPHRRELGQWLYGCDACQDACPYNRHSWQESEEFPGLGELGKLLNWENLLTLDDDDFQQTLLRKFWYIAPEDSWKGQVNALNAILNSGDPKFLPLVTAACQSRHAAVREMAEFVTLHLTAGESHE